MTVKEEEVAATVGLHMLSYSCAFVLSVYHCFALLLEQTYGQSVTISGSEQIWRVLDTVNSSTSPTINDVQELFRTSVLR